MAFIGRNRVNRLSRANMVLGDLERRQGQGQNVNAALRNLQSQTGAAVGDFNRQLSNRLGNDPMKSPPPTLAARQALGFQAQGGINRALTRGDEAQEALVAGFQGAGQMRQVQAQQRMAELLANAEVGKANAEVGRMNQQGRLYAAQAALAQAGSGDLQAQGALRSKVAETDPLAALTGRRAPVADAPTPLDKKRVEEIDAKIEKMKKDDPETAQRLSVLSDKAENLSSIIAGSMTDQPWAKDQLQTIYDEIDRLTGGSGGGGNPGAADQFDVGEVKEVNGQQYRYVGNDEWEPVE